MGEWSFRNVASGSSRRYGMSGFRVSNAYDNALHGRDCGSGDSPTKGHRDPFLIYFSDISIQGMRII